MDSEEIYRYKPRPALEALKLQAEEHLAEFAPLEGGQPPRPTRHDDIAPDQTEYKGKGHVRSLGLMFKAGEDEI